MARVWPLVYLLGFLGFIGLVVLIGSQLGIDVFSFLLQAFFVLYAAALVLCLVHLWSMSDLPRPRKWFWTVILPLGGPFSVPLYCYYYIWLDPPCRNGTRRKLADIHTVRRQQGERRGVSPTWT